jgi:hypothetical protein
VLFGPAVHVPADAGAAQWIGPALGGFGSVGGVVPHGYERYLLLDHRDEAPREWELLDRLVPLLATATSTPGRCWFAIWEGYGFTTFTNLYSVQPSDADHRRGLDRERRRLRSVEERRKRAIRSELDALPTFELPHRRYHLVQGPVTAAAEIANPDGVSRQVPDLWWPEDRRWFVGGDTDLDWWYIAGPEALLSAVAAEFNDRAHPVDWMDPNTASL